MTKKDIMTRAVRAGEYSPKSTSAPKTVPIYMSSSFAFDDVETLEEIYAGKSEGYVYSRMANPGHDTLKSVVAEIEEGEGVEVYSSGMAAITMSIMAHVQAGDHIIAGIVVSDKETIAKIHHTGLLFGPTMSPFDSWLLTRSLRTLNLRIRQHSENALKLAKFFENHEKVKNVFYPGLESAEDHDLANDMFNNNLFGGMLSIDLAGGDKAACDLISNLESIKFVPSLAGVATSVSVPVRTSHRALSDKELIESNISRGMLRISAGLENADDLIREFEEGLAKL